MGRHELHSFEQLRKIKPQEGSAFRLIFFGVNVYRYGSYYASHESQAFAAGHTLRSSLPTGSPEEQPLQIIFGTLTGHPEASARIPYPIRHELPF